MINSGVRTVILIPNLHRRNGLDVIKYFERNYRHLLLCTVMMIKDVDRAQDILHNVVVTLLTKQDELRDLRHLSRNAELPAKGVQIGGARPCDSI